MHATWTYELEKLENIIRELITPDPNLRPTLFPREAELRDALRSETERVKKQLIREVFQIEDEFHLQRYIQFHQQQIIRQLDQMRSVIIAKQEHRTGSEDLEFTMHTLNELLKFIEQHFARYVDLDIKAPSSYTAMTGGEMIILLAEFQEELRRQDTEIRLVTMVLSPVRKFIERIPSGEITYRDIIYVKEVAKELRKTITVEHPSAGINERIQLLFLYLNYNTINYFNYYTLQLQDQIKKIEEIPKRIELLSLLLKNINQVQTRHMLAYSTTRQSLKEQIVNWLTEEMAYEEKRYVLSQKYNQPAGHIAADFKVQAEMSLSQLAYLLRIFVDTKIVQNKNLSELFRFTSKNYQVKNQNITYESFRVRYYNPEESIRKSVRSLLLQLVDHINKT